MIAYVRAIFGTPSLQPLYVANGFLSAFIIAVAMLHVYNSLAVCKTLTKSYSIYAGTVDAMVHFWMVHFWMGDIGIVLYIASSRRRGKGMGTC